LEEKEDIFEDIQLIVMRNIEAF